MRQQNLDVLGQTADLTDFLLGLRPAGFRIGFADGLSSAETVGHAVVHVVPETDGREIPLPDGVNEWVRDGVAR